MCCVVQGRWIRLESKCTSVGWEVLRFLNSEIVSLRHPARSHYSLYHSYQFRPYKNLNPNRSPSTHPPNYLLIWTQPSSHSVRKKSLIVVPKILDCTIVGQNNSASGTITNLTRNNRQAKLEVHMDLSGLTTRTRKLRSRLARTCASLNLHAWFQRTSRQPTRQRWIRHWRDTQVCGEPHDHADELEWVGSAVFKDLFFPILSDLSTLKVITQRWCIYFAENSSY